VKSRDHVDMSNYVTNGEWSFVGTRIVRNEVRYPIGPAVYPDVTVYVTMRRRILYYMLNITLPAVSFVLRREILRRVSVDYLTHYAQHNSAGI